MLEEKLILFCEHVRIGVGGGKLIVYLIIRSQVL